MGVIGVASNLPKAVFGSEDLVPNCNEIAEVVPNGCWAEVTAALEATAVNAGVDAPKANGVAVTSDVELAPLP